ncbi:MAG: ADOP family duplicated permease [Vicinamibacterales bacterium]
MSIRRRLRSALWRVPVEQEVREELAHHVELRTAELIARGWPPAEARAEAERRIAGTAPGLARLAEARNRRWRVAEWCDALAQDTAFALRQCGRQPGFTAAAVLTLALGIGATTAIFSVVDAVLLRPFPFAHPERVLDVYTTSEGQPSNTSVGAYAYFRERATTLEHLAAVQYLSFNLAEGGSPARVIGARVTSNFFPTFGVAPTLGRVFTADDDQPGRDGVVVLGHGLWTRRFGANPAIVGQDIHLNSEPHTVIGVMPPAFDGVGPGDDLWVPQAFTAAQLATFDAHYLDLVGLRADTATDAQVSEELARLARQLEQDHPEDNVARGAAAESLTERVVGDSRPRLLVLLAAVVLVLGIACANVANLTLARLAARSRELALRAAIGAGRGRIVRQVLTESLVLSALGGAMGVAAAYWTLPVLVRLAPAGVPRLDMARLDGTSLLAALALAAVCAAVVGVLPAWQATGGGHGTLGDGRGAAAGVLRPRLRQVLIGAQAALVLVVLCGAALLVRSAINLQRVPLGVDRTGVVMGRVTLPVADYDPARTYQAYVRLLDTLSAQPGVATAALDSHAPLMPGGGANGLIPEGRPVSAANAIVSSLHVVTPGYFEAMGLPLVAGRGFTRTDVRASQLVMVVNESMARTAWPGEDPVGKRVACCESAEGAPVWKVVVGVVPDVRLRGPATPAQPEFYLPMAQVPPDAWSWIQNSMSIVARGAGAETGPLAGAIREAVRAVDPTVPVYALATMDERLAGVLAGSRFNTLLMTMLGAAGLVLAALGIYSVVSWLVAQRSREIGVRMALGASPRQVTAAVTGLALQPVLLGLAAGVVVVLAGGRVIESQLFAVDSRDPLALGVVVGLLLAVAAAAALVPAWRAASIDPATAIRD